VKLI
jgi:hypothetical protein